ncbi:MAG: dihydropteroate synthase [Deltaproteobacteria bacterium]|nr:dihydropteroate synthase [Deltaproteobacteria bacterium]MBW2072806.1 dihydropteroate synthase [Deltaproteobacteria bacterium]
MILIGENVNIMSKKYGKAMKEKDAKIIQELAVQEQEAGMDYVDLNIGPAGRIGEELMEWIVKTVQEVVDLPCALDTSNVNAIRAGLKVHKGRALINSISARPDRMEALLPLAKEFDADFVGLLWGPEGMPRDEHERGALAETIRSEAAALDIPMERIWLDPIVTPVNVQQNQVLALYVFMRDYYSAGVFEGCTSTCGLSNVSNGAPEHLRPILNQTYLLMLKRWGMASAIVDTFDTELHKFARGEVPEIEALVNKVIDEEPIDMDSLSKEERDYVKTARVLLSQSLYSDSWLEI